MEFVANVAGVVVVIWLLVCLGLGARRLDEAAHQRRQRNVVEGWVESILLVEDWQAVLKIAYPGDETIKEVTTTRRLDLAVARYRHAKAEQRAAELCKQLEDSSPVVRMNALVAVIMEDVNVYGLSSRITSPSGLRARYEQTLRAVTGLCGRGDVAACEDYAVLVRRLYDQYSDEEVCKRFDSFRLEPPLLPSQ